MNVCRTRFNNDVVTEFMVPRNKKSQRIMIFCAGVPGVPHKDEMLDFWSKEGYWTFFPRYRGTWESSGTFLKESPEQVIFDIIENLTKGFTDYWSSNTYQIDPKHITVVGSSFGGPAALLASLNPQINKAICISPVVDWIAENKADPIDNLYNLLHEAYGEAYRLHKTSWNKLKTGKFYNPNQYIKLFDRNKIIIFHAKNDKIVHFKPVEKFAKKIKCQFITFKKGGHLSSSLLMQSGYSKQIKKFLNS